MATATVEKQSKGDSQAAGQRYTLIPIGLIQESKSNPRKAFDAAALEELAASVEKHGIVEPLIVRQLEGKDAPYELVAGARRLRAARKAKLGEVPCMVRELSDDEALEIQVIENLQRADLTPLEEARGYQELLKRGYKVEDLARKIDKSERYVYARMELIKLSEPVQKSLDEGKITASHAQLIATIQKPEDQKKALDLAFVKEWGATDDLLVEAHKEDVAGLVGVRDFQKTILAIKVGEELVAKVESLKSGGHKSYLVSEREWIRGGKEIYTRRRWKSQGAKPCKHEAKGVLVDDKGRGKVLDICVTTSCTKHFATHPVSSPPSPKPGDAAKEAAKRAAAQAKAELDKKIRLEVWRQISGKVREVPKKLVAALIAREVASCNDDYDHLSDVMPGLGRLSEQALAGKLAAASELMVAKVGLGVMLAADINPDSYNAVTMTLGEVAKDLKIDVKALEKGLRGKFEAEQRDAAEKGKPLIRWINQAGDMLGKVPGISKPFVIKHAKVGGRDFFTWTRSGGPGGVGASNTVGLSTLEAAKNDCEKNARKVLGK